MATTENPLTNGSATGTSTGIKDRVTQATDRVRHTAADFGRSAATNIDKNIDSAAGALQGAAEQLRTRAGMGEGKVNRIAHTTAEKLETTARYFREHHTREMMDGLESTVRRNPGMSLGIALGVGFLIGMTMKRDRPSY
jgi:ElaB/YqjD/DUF883 family membrane-anchored ribosome-binding protein